MTSLRTVVVLIALSLCILSETVEYGEGGRRKAKKEDMPKAQFPADHGETRSLHFQYTIESETVMYDVLSHKVEAPSTYLKAKLFFDILHHGNGEILANWRLDECITNNCGNPPPVWVNFRQGGNNIIEVYIDPKDVEPDFVPRWNFLYAIVHSIYTPAESGEGDEQYVKTPYGMCNVLFTRPEDKRFRRQMRHCDLKGINNHTRVDGLVATRYNNDAHYIQNVKRDADIVIIDTIEELGLSSPFNDQFGVVIETRSHMEMHNRTFEVIPRLCELGFDVDKCAQELGLRKVGDRLYENVELRRVDEQAVQKDFFNQAIIRLRKVYADDNSWSTEHAKAYGDLLQASLHVENAAQILGEALLEDDNYDIRRVLSSALGSLGGVESVKVARDIIYKEDSLKRFGFDFLFGIAHHTLASNDKFFKELMYWLADTPSDSKLYWELANTIATVLRRDCDRSTSAKNQCLKGKRPIVEKFIKDISMCEKDECVEKALEVFINLPLPGSVSFAKSHICSSSPSIQLKALQVIEHAPHTLFDSDMIYTLIRAFRNTCPSSTPTSASMAALNALLRSIPDNSNAATLILRTESPLSPADHELWSYVYEAVKTSRLFDVSKDDFWSRLRSFRVFRPNYAQRSLKADSTAFGRDIMEFAGFRGRMKTAAEFGQGIVKSSHILMSAIKGWTTKAPEYPLFELQLESSGLESYMDSDHPISDVSSPKSSVRLSLLSHSLPPFVAFDGHQALMSAVMSANGQTIRAFEGTVPLRLFSTSYPLLSGATVTFDASITTVARVFGSAEISLWSRESTSVLNVNSTTVISATGSVLLDGVELHRLTSDLSLVTAVKSTTEARFAAKPYRFCVNMGSENSVAGLSTEWIKFEGETSPKMDKTDNSRVIPGESWYLGEHTRKQCRLWMEKSE